MSQTAVLVKEKGEVTMSKSFDFLCSQLRNGRYKVTIERYTEPRTLSQNALMWLWFKCIEDETGTLSIEIYNHYCKKFLAYVNDWGEEVYTTSSHLNTKQMTDFLNKVKADAASELGIMLPLPADRFYQEFINEYKYRR